MKTLAPFVVCDAPTANFVAIDISQQLNWMALTNRVRDLNAHTESSSLLFRWWVQSTLSNVFYGHAARLRQLVQKLLTPFFFFSESPNALLFFGPTHLFSWTFSWMMMSTRIVWFCNISLFSLQISINLICSIHENLPRKKLIYGLIKFLNPFYLIFIDKYDSCHLIDNEQLRANILYWD